MLNLDQIKNALIGTIKSVDILNHGHSSTAYNIVTSLGEYVALTQKKDSIEKADYVLTYVILKGLEKIDYKYAPKAVYLSNDKEILLMTKVAGQSFEWVNNQTQEFQWTAVKKIIDSLLDLRNVSFEYCDGLYREITGNAIKKSTLRTNFDKHVMSRFNVAIDSKCADPLVMKWLKPKIDNIEKIVNQSVLDINPVLVHGDTSEGNIFIDEQLNLSLIDWNDGGFYQYPSNLDAFGLGYLFNHVPIFQKFRKKILELVSGKVNMDVIILDKIILKRQEITKIGDIVWAFMMNARVKSGEITGDPAKYLDIANRRISEYESVWRR